METESTRAISEVKQELRLREWSEQIERQQSSGMSVEAYLTELFSKPAGTLLMPWRTENDAQI